MGSSRVEPIVCVPTVECVCNYLFDGLWACTADAFMFGCGNGRSPVDPDNRRGQRCVPPTTGTVPPTATAFDEPTDDEEEEKAGGGDGSSEGDAVEVVPAPTPIASNNGNGNGNDEECANNGIGSICYDL